jgi:hypothetical protein
MDYDDLPLFENFRRPRRRNTSRQPHKPIKRCPIQKKHCYPSRAKAEQSRIDALNAGAGFIRTYFHRLCGYWHITHQQPNS